VGLWQPKVKDKKFKQEFFNYRRRKGRCIEEIYKKRRGYGIISASSDQAHNLSSRKMKSWTNVTGQHQLCNIDEPHEAAE
jgi:hypothetical protein